MIAAQDPSSVFEGVSFRLARNDDEDADRFCGLFNSLYTRRVDRSYYRWQFFQTPEPSFLSYALTRDHHLTGCYGFHLQDSGGTKTAWALDIMIAPSFQGKGLFRTLARFAALQVMPHNPVALLVMANQRADAAHVHGLGWKRVNTLLTHVCPSSKAPRQSKSMIHVIPVAEANAAYWSPATNRHERAFSVWRTVPFVEWRFQRNPWYGYHLFQAERRNRPFGHLALKAFRDPTTGESYGDIVDIGWRERDGEALGQMLNFALDHFHARGILQAAIWLQTHTLLDEVAHEIGFRKTESRRYFCCRVLDNRYQWLEDSRRWFLTMADSEIF